MQHGLALFAQVSAIMFLLQSSKWPAISQLEGLASVFHSYQETQYSKLKEFVQCAHCNQSLSLVLLRRDLHGQILLQPLVSPGSFCLPHQVEVAAVGLAMKFDGNNLAIFSGPFPRGEWS